MIELERLRSAARELGPERVIHALSRTLDAWRDPDGPWCAQLAESHGVFSRAMIVWNESTVRAAITIGSTVASGFDPWPPRP